MALDNYLTYGVLGLAILLVLLAAKRVLAPPPPPPRSYVGTDLHREAVVQVIELVAARIVKTFPDEDEFEQARRVRDELMLSKMHNVDNHAMTILTVVKRFRGTDRPEPGAIQKWTD